MEVGEIGEGSKKGGEGVRQSNRVSGLPYVTLPPP